ncbi:hypothetical protein LEP1GSC016_2208 [Leptospira borgpetersenii serovar Hardjo-bovis str. Sponselee]|uniref:Uncharacterized protein n=1 Tax=Leptospira borgpetersenii serovar Hardjo-bovis str. Sponselee TaxID=1303729 RepID=M6BVS0_LEPBO|nr:hypothetical protein LEP1GSC016_2208 [Leptospira borgpetersenii serovar Hardjo-bovis str. Sponselee]
MGDLKNMRKKIYCSGWGAISDSRTELKPQMYIKKINNK